MCSGQCLVASTLSVPYTSLYGGCRQDPVLVIVFLSVVTDFSAYVTRVLMYCFEPKLKGIIYVTL